MVQDTVKAFAKTNLSTRIIQGNREETFDRNIMKEMGELGLLGCTLKGYGCAGMGYVSYGLIANAVESVDSGYRLICLLHRQISIINVHNIQVGNECPIKFGDVADLHVRDRQTKRKIPSRFGQRESGWMFWVDRAQSWV